MAKEVDHQRLSTQVEEIGKKSTKSVSLFKSVEIGLKNRDKEDEEDLGMNYDDGRGLDKNSQ